MVLNLSLSWAFSALRKILNMGSKRAHWHGSPLRVACCGDNLDSAMLYKVAHAKLYILLNKPLDCELLVICHTVVAKCEHSPVAGSDSRRAEGCGWPAESRNPQRALWEGKVAGK